jgi:hypothetical protein
MNREVRMAGRSARNVGTAVLIALTAVGLSRMRASVAGDDAGAGAPFEVRGVYGGVPKEILGRGEALDVPAAVLVGPGDPRRSSVHPALPAPFAAKAPARIGSKLGAELAMQPPLAYNPNPAFSQPISDNPNDLRLKPNACTMLPKR